MENEISDEEKYKTTFESWNQVADDYHKILMGMDLYTVSYDLFCELIEENNAKVLEIGCGPGNITRYLHKKRPDLQFKATDISPEMIKLAKTFIPAVDFEILDCREIYKLVDKFDAIICRFVIPYLSIKNSEKLISDCENLLSENGIFYYSFIEGEYSNSGFEKGSSGHEMYIYYYQEKYLHQVLSENNFKLLSTFRKSYTNARNQNSTHVINIAQKL